MKLTKRQLKRIIREEYTRLKRRGLIREALSSDSDTADHYGMQMAEDPVIAQAIEKQDAIPQGHDYRKPAIFSYCNEWLSLIDQCINRGGELPESIARDISSAGTDGQRAWSCAYKLLKDIPGNEEHMELCDEIDDILWEEKQSKYR